MKTRLVTANLLCDGAVVYLQTDRSWGLDPRSALMSDDGAVLEELVAQARSQSLVVVDPYVVDVERDGTRLRFPSARERIRAEGPEAVLERFGYAHLLRAAAE